ncbi:MAG: potassium channel family protein [Propionibacteriales bacterium]|nr:potassium channel family protein [Propionibacteriales bacterium]
MRNWPKVVNRVVLPVAILVFYFVVPVSSRDAPLGLLLGTLLGAALLALVAKVVFTELRREERRLKPIHLLIAFELALVTFSLGYYLLAHANPAEFTGLTTRLDALYFSMTTMATVGYGDVSASGQLARLLVTIQLAFNLVFIAALFGLLQDQVRHGALRRKADAAPAEADDETERP